MKVSAAEKAGLIDAITTCATEGDVVQVLYGALRPFFGYEAVVLHVLERDGWYRYLAVDHGVLQDGGRRRLSESYFAENYRESNPAVVHRVPSPT